MRGPDPRVSKVQDTALWDYLLIVGQLLKNVVTFILQAQEWCELLIYYLLVCQNGSRIPILNPCNYKSLSGAKEGVGSEHRY